MNTQKLEGFLNIPFGASQEIAKEKMRERNGVIDSENSNENAIIYNGVSFAGRNTELIILTFFENQFTKASVYVRPSLESKVIETYIQIKSEINQKYFQSEKDFETYEHPYEKNDGYTESAISLGKAEFCCFWSFANDGEDDFIALSINEQLEIQISYENGDLMQLFIKKTKSQNSLDY